MAKIPTLPVVLVHHDILDAHFLHRAALLAVWIPPDIKLSERDLHYLRANGPLVVTVPRREYVPPVDQGAAALVLDTPGNLNKWRKSAWALSSSSEWIQAVAGPLLLATPGKMERTQCRWGGTEVVR